jgi:biotin carboxyl carrier protein
LDRNERTLTLVTGEVAVASGIVEQDQNSQNSGQQQTAGTISAASPASRSPLVQRLLDAPNLPAFINDLLTTQAVVVAGTEAAGFVLEAGENNTASLRPIAHIRPDASTAEVRAAALGAFQDLVKPCIEQNRDGAIQVAEGSEGSEAQFCLVTLLRNDGQVVAASAVITRCLNVERARQRLTSMQLVAGYFDLFTLRRNAEQARDIAQSHQYVLQYTTAVATAEGFESAGANLCNELANRTHATRVSLGWVKGRNIKVKAISHTEEFDKKQELVVLLAKVMEECADQEAVVQYDPTGKGTDNVTRDAQQLSRTQGGHIVLSMPLRRQAEVIGVITCEFLPGTQITPQASSALATAVDLLAPQLWDRYQNDRWLITKVGISTREVAKATIGPKHMLAKLIAAAVVGVILAAVLIRPMYRISAPFSFMTDTRSTLSAPFEGKLGEVAWVQDPYTHQQRRLKPGDLVKKGDVLVSMDTSEETLQYWEADAQAKQYRANAAQERSKNEPDSQAKAKIADYQADEAEAKKQLLALRIDQGKIRAPIDGVLLKGDLEDQRGKPVKQGDELMVVGRPEQLKAEIEVAERDIQEVKVGQLGWIATSSLPGDKHPIKIERIVPIGNPNKEGQNVFKVYGTLQDTVGTWRPGMAGEAKVEVERKPLWWIYSHKLIEFVKLQAWKWGV